MTALNRCRNHESPATRSGDDGPVDVAASVPPTREAEARISELLPRRSSYDTSKVSPGFSAPGLVRGTGQSRGHNAVRPDA